MFLVSFIGVSHLVRTVHSVFWTEQEEEEAQGLLGERVVNTPEASSMVFLRAVSFATLWLSRLSRSWEQNGEVMLLGVFFNCQLACDFY